MTRKACGAFKRGYERKRYVCDECNRSISATNIKRHKDVCGKPENSKKRHISCMGCKNVFWSYGNTKYCSKACFNGSIDPEFISNRMKEDYSSGKLIPYGGGMKRFLFERKDGLVVKVQGTYELKACLIFERWKKDGMILDWAYTPSKFPYLDKNGKQRTYFPDFQIFNVNENYYIEVKGFETENDKFKWESLRDKNIRLDVWMKKEIEYYSALG